MQLDLERFGQCLDSERTASAIKRDIEDGLALKLQGTPSFVIDAKTYTGVLPPDVLAAYGIDLQDTAAETESNK